MRKVIIEAIRRGVTIDIDPQAQDWPVVICGVDFEDGRAFCLSLTKAQAIRIRELIGQHLDRLVDTHA